MSRYIRRVHYVIYFTATVANQSRCTSLTTVNCSQVAREIHLAAAMEVKSYILGLGMSLRYPRFGINFAATYCATLIKFSGSVHFVLRDV